MSPLPTETPRRFRPRGAPTVSASTHPPEPRWTQRAPGLEGKSLAEPPLQRRTPSRGRRWGKGLSRGCPGGRSDCRTVEAAERVDLGLVWFGERVAPVAPGSRAVFLALRFSLKRLGSGEVGVLSRLPAATGRRCQPLAGTWAGYRGEGGRERRGGSSNRGEKERLHNLH